MKQSDSSAFAGPWPKGMTNRMRDAEIPEDTLRNGVNVNLTRAGGVFSRSGYTLAAAGDYHSVWGDDGDFGLCVKGSNLIRLDVSSAGVVTETTIFTGMELERKVSYVRVNDDIFWSNGVRTGKVSSGVNVAWGVEHSAPPAAAALSYGGMNAGIYQVAITYVTASGEEGGTSRAVSVTVAEGGGIALSSIPQPIGSNVAAVLIYITNANGEVFYEYASIAVGVTTLTLAASVSLGRELTTWGMYPAPPGELLELHGASILIASGQYLYFTEPFFYGQHKRLNVYQFRDTINMVASLNAKLVAVAADIHYLLSGADPSGFEMTESYRYPAIQGTLTKTPENKRIWLSANGWMVYDPSSGFSETVSDRVWPEDATYGASLYRQEDGETFIISSLIDGAASASLAQDYFDAEIIRKT